MAIETIKMPDLGADNAQVIEILVSVGETITPDSALFTLEGEKATMEVPSGVHGQVSKILLSIGDSVQTGVPCLEVEVVASDQPKEEPVEEKDEVVPLLVPELGTDQATVIELFVQVGDEVKKDQPLLTLEGEKATMELPSPYDGKVTAWHISMGQSLKTGEAMGEMQTMADVATKAPMKAPESKATPAPSRPPQARSALATESSILSEKRTGQTYAGPATRRVANRFGVDLSYVVGRGERGRVTPQDVLLYIKERVIQAQSGQVQAAKSTTKASDFSEFGPVEEVPLGKIKQFSGRHLTHAWQSIPHVTQYADVDITAIEAARKEAKSKGNKFSVMMVVVHQLVASLKAFPSFNASLCGEGKNLLLKSYYHIGVAVDTPQGLVVPVIRDVDQKTLMGLGDEITTIAEKARTKGLTPHEMKGGTFTVSSLGGIGGTAFTPIVNAPEVAILGLARASMQPVFNGSEFEPRLKLPLCLSYDHRVIDGAEGIRFLVDLTKRLEALTCDDVLAMSQA